MLSGCCALRSGTRRDGVRPLRNAAVSHDEHIVGPRAAREEPLERATIAEPEKERKNRAPLGHLALQRDGCRVGLACNMFPLFYVLLLAAARASDRRAIAMQDYRFMAREDLDMTDFFHMAWVTPRLGHGTAGCGAGPRRCSFFGLSPAASSASSRAGRG